MVFIYFNIDVTKSRHPICKTKKASKLIRPKEYCILPAGKTAFQKYFSCLTVFGIYDWLDSQSWLFLYKLSASQY